MENQAGRRVVNGLLEIALHYDYLGYAGSQRGRLYWCLWGGGQGLAAVTAPCGYTQDARKTHARHTQDTRKTAPFCCKIIQTARQAVQKMYFLVL